MTEMTYRDLSREYDGAIPAQARIDAGLPAEDSPMLRPSPIPLRDRLRAYNAAYLEYAVCRDLRRALLSGPTEFLRFSFETSVRVAKAEVDGLITRTDTERMVAWARALVAGENPPLPPFPRT